MGHTFKDSPQSRKNREEKFGSRKKEKRVNRSKIKQQLNHDNLPYDDDEEEMDWVEDYRYNR